MAKVILMITSIIVITLLIAISFIVIIPSIIADIVIIVITMMAFIIATIAMLGRGFAHARATLASAWSSACAKYWCGFRV